jgi:hypothetical protein
MIILRITEATMYQIRTDLVRPHPFAYERIGFLYLRQGLYDNGILLIATTYESVPDDQYIYDPSVGARINSDAIRNTMQRIMDTGESALHIHMHEHAGPPAFSPTDKEDLGHLIQSFRKVGIDVAHGAAILSDNDISAVVWIPKSERPTLLDKISIIGFPTIFYERNVYGRI